MVATLTSKQRGGGLAPARALRAANRNPGYEPLRRGGGGLGPGKSLKGRKPKSGLATLKEGGRGVRETLRAANP